MSTLKIGPIIEQGEVIEIRCNDVPIPITEPFDVSELPRFSEVIQELGKYVDIHEILILLKQDQKYKIWTPEVLKDYLPHLKPVQLKILQILATNGELSREELLAEIRPSLETHHKKESWSLGAKIGGLTMRAVVKGYEPLIGKGLEGRRFIYRLKRPEYSEMILQAIEEQHLPLE